MTTRESLDETFNNITRAHLEVQGVRFLMPVEPEEVALLVEVGR
jgi:hypothetical protein